MASQPFMWELPSKMKAASMQAIRSIEHHHPLKEAASSKGQPWVVSYAVLQRVHGDTVTPKSPQIRT
uniref:Uncharacterized protein n=1 Tax=Arundo donax TaxID=35708 RepID=A0A0A9DWK3_ARUDO